ncbi:hypothetical protein ACSYDW_18540 [Paeniglutamicibacter sp. R2-26]|uniref:hypothetical protein n=1 Tax=Paeniglutamicibacter sp. R2-26 TaxID=3144417 RepID=UPI003EE463B6
MTTHSTRHPVGEVDPQAELLLRSSDPLPGDHVRALEHSRSRSAAIPSGTYVPSISQQVLSLAPAPAGNARVPGRLAHGAPTRRRWGVFLAVVSSAAIVAVIAVLLPWGSGRLPVAPQPAAPATAVAPSPSDGGFNPNYPDQREAFRESGGYRITGWLRPALPTDPAELRRTGWLLNVYTVAGSDETIDTADGPWTPIDLGGRDTSLLARNQEAGTLVVVASRQPDLKLVVPVPGPYGILVSDPVRLASGTVDDATSLMTLEGDYLQIPDVRLNGARLSQFAAFGMAHTYTGTPGGSTTGFKASGFHSYTDPEARSCIAAVTKSGIKILSFPAGSTASGSIEGEPLPDEPMARHSLRVMPQGAQLSEGDGGSTFILDTGATPATTFTAWPTAETGTCGDHSGQIVKFKDDGQ